MERARERKNMSGSCQTLENVQWQRCARAAPCSPVSLLTHTGSIMSLPPTVLSLSSPLPLSLTRHPSRFSFPSLPSLSPFHPTVFLVLHQSAVSRPALARHVRTASCSASLSLSLSVDQPVGGFSVLFFSCSWIQFGSVIFVSGNMSFNLEHAGQRHG